MIVTGHNVTEARQVGGLVRSPDQAAQDVLVFALDYCRGMLGAKADPGDLLRGAYPDAQGYFRYGLALGLAEYLAEADPTVTAAYLGDWEDPQEEIGAEAPRATSPLLLIVRVGRKTAALESLLADLSVALTAHYRHSVGATTGMTSGLLCTNVVDDREANEGVGYGAVLSGFHQRPTRVWAR
jgi:hypothetical protein